MRRVRLGRTRLEVSQLGLGGLFVASCLADYEQARAAVRRAVELGVNYIDTAPNYWNSEEVLGRALADIRQPLVISTKLGGRPTPFDPKDRAGLRASVEESLRLLGRDHVDMLLIHEPDRPGQYDWWDDWQGPRGPVLEVLDELKQRGLIRFTGLGGTTAYEMAHLLRGGLFDVVLTAYNYSLLWREAALEVLPAARAQHMGVIAGSPLQQGALARRWDHIIDDPRIYWLSPQRREQFRALYRFVEECGIPLPELGLRFVISNADVHCVLMGARSPQEVEANVAAVEKGPLPADVLARLDAIAAMLPCRPFCEPFGLGWHFAAPERYHGPAMA